MLITYKSSKFGSKFKKKNFSFLEGSRGKKIFEKFVFGLCKKQTIFFCLEFSADSHHIGFFWKILSDKKWPYRHPSLVQAAPEFLKNFSKIFEIE